MAAAIDSSRSVGSRGGSLHQNDNFFSWNWILQPLNGISKSVDSVSSSGSASLVRSTSVTTFSSTEGDNTSEIYSRSSSGSSTGFAFGIDYVPDRTEMKKVFEKIDENKDGKICGSDLHRFMSRLKTGMSLAEANTMLKSVDYNSDGCVDFEEFYSLYMSLSGDDRTTDEVDATAEEDDDTLLQVFQVFDRNGDGVITPQELQQVLNQLGFLEGKDLSNCKKMIQRVDSNGDELIDLTEFKIMMRSGGCVQYL